MSRKAPTPDHDPPHLVRGISAERRAPFGDSPRVGDVGRRTQQRILTAALEVFDEVGYHSARIDAIADRAGCSRPTFYQYFANKEALFNRLGGLLGTSLASLTEEFPVVAPGSPPSDELRMWVGDLVDLHASWEPAFAAFRPALRGDPLLKAGAADLMGRYGKSVARSVPEAGATQRAGQAESEVVAALGLTMLLGALNLRASMAVDASASVDRVVVVDELSELLHMALVGSSIPSGAASGARRREAVARGAVDPASGGVVEVALERAALRVFPRLGFEGTRVDDLVVEAGVAHGTFYRYFASKAELFEQVAGRAVTAMFDLLADLPAALTGRNVDRWTERWFATYLDHGAIFSVWAEAPRSEAGFSEGAAVAALELVSAASGEHDPTVGSVGALGVLSLIEWSPYLVQHFDGFDREPTQRATALLLDRLLAPGPASP